MQSSKRNYTRPPEFVTHASHPAEAALIADDGLPRCRAKADTLYRGGLHYLGPPSYPFSRPPLGSTAHWGECSRSKSGGVQFCGVPAPPP